MRTVGWLLSVCVASLHYTCGVVAYRLGCRAFARRRFERVLELYGACFLAYVHLGRIAFDHGDYATWRRELEHARRLDPRRFSRLRHPLELAEPRLAGTTFGHALVDGPAYDGTRATWGSLQNTPRPRLDTRVDANVPLEGNLESLLPDCSDPMIGDVPSDDCTHPSERSRFARLGPIARAELQRCDLDELARRLTS